MDPEVSQHLHTHLRRETGHTTAAAAAAAAADR